MISFNTVEDVRSIRMMLEEEKASLNDEIKSLFGGRTYDSDIKNTFSKNQHMYWLTLIKSIESINAQLDLMDIIQGIDGKARMLYLDKKLKELRKTLNIK